MKSYFVQVILSCALLLGCATQGLSQRACPVPPPSPYRHNGQIVTRFERGGVRTTLDPMLIRGSQQDGLFLHATFSHLPRAQAARQTVELAFLSVSQTARFHHAPGLTLMVDGQPVALPGAVQYRSDSRDRLTLETARIVLPVESFRNLLRARRVTARLGPTEFQLRENHLEALREVASLVAPQSARR